MHANHHPETLFDLLELYTDQRPSTTVGPHFPADRFLTVRIPLNQEAVAQHIPRYTHSTDRHMPKEPPKPANGASANLLETPQRLDHPLTPTAANGDRHQASESARDAAVRYMLDPVCADNEKRQVAEYFNVEMEEYEVEE